VSGTRHPGKAPVMGALPFSGGFSLIELIAVLVIAGVLAAMAVPRFMETQSFAERGYAEELAAGLRHARNVAVASGCAVRVTIGAAGYNAAQPAAGGGPFANHCQAPGAAWPTVVTRTDGSRLEGVPPRDANIVAPVQLVFDSQGNTVASLVEVGNLDINVAANGVVSVQ
jgi:MSHA pilin protein MshC